MALGVYITHGWIQRGQFYLEILDTAHASRIKNPRAVKNAHDRNKSRVRISLVKLSGSTNGYHHMFWTAGMTPEAKVKVKQI